MEEVELGVHQKQDLEPAEQQEAEAQAPHPEERCHDHALRLVEEVEVNDLEHAASLPQRQRGPAADAHDHGLDARAG